MKRHSLLCVAALLCSSKGLYAQDSVSVEPVSSAKLAIKQFATELKGTLQRGIQTEGIVSAISICNDKANGIAEKHSVSSGWTVSRTALKWRNPDNAPDEWEHSILASFERQLAEGKPISELDAYFELGDSARYMKAIPTQDVCLKCHGTTISEVVQEKLELLYPDDRATGFSTGQIRGAFSLTRSLATNK